MKRDDIIRMATESNLSEEHMNECGYYCVICNRILPADDCGVIVHDPIPHPPDMDFAEEEKPQ
jgi:hypothetical protein